MSVNVYDRAYWDASYAAALLAKQENAAAKAKTPLEHDFMLQAKTKKFRNIVVTARG